MSVTSITKKRREYIRSITSNKDHVWKWSIKCCTKRTKL